MRHSEEYTPNSIPCTNCDGSGLLYDGDIWFNCPFCSIVWDEDDRDEDEEESFDFDSY